MNVLKPYLQSTEFTLLERNKSQRQIRRLTGIDRKTIRRYQAIFESQQASVANSPGVTTGSEAATAQNPLLSRLARTRSDVHFLAGTRSTLAYAEHHDCSLFAARFDTGFNFVALNQTRLR
ncbi:integrase catalytic subunit [Caballeronia choica]|uniref:Integrase catalytic subunit n=1 Tax=Caballeronia choica TaxID=326476 RepID=A0A158KRN0_9BURK|nr:integrase catalytic subunit [Caballeronia choica]